MLKRNPLLGVAAAAVLAAGMALPVAASADAIHEQIMDESRPGEVAMITDVLLARPAYLAGSVFGGIIFVISAPFSLAGGNVGQAWDSLVMTPVSNAFLRCLGCTPVQYDNLVRDRREANEKRDADTPVPESAN